MPDPFNCRHYRKYVKEERNDVSVPGDPVIDTVLYKLRTFCKDCGKEIFMTQGTTSSPSTH